jgi:hypothetical protein
MRRRLVTLPARTLWAVALTACLLAAGAAVAAAAVFSSSASPPAPKPLARAVHDALTAPPVAGVTARITFADHLIPSGLSGHGGPPAALSGADGRLWATRDGRWRLELQSDSGDLEIGSDGTHLTAYDATSNTMYEATLPQDKAHKREAGHMHGPPTVAQIRRALAHAGAFWNLSGAQPTTTGNRPSYTLRAAPKRQGGLLGAAELAWDAARGVPLRFAIFARGQSSPVVALAVSHIAYGPVSASDVAVSRPTGAKVVTVTPPQHAAKGARRGHAAQVHGAAAVARRLSFALAAPARLGSLHRTNVSLLGLGGSPGAFAAYGHGLGTVVVLERKAKPGEQPFGSGRDSALPQVAVPGATARELATPLGTVVSFERAGVSYTVAGSVPPAVAERAARSLR